MEYLTELQQKNYFEGIKLCEKIAKSFGFKYSVADKDELLSCLLEKLVRIVRKYEPEKQVPFKYFCLPSLRGYAWNFIRDNCRTIKIPRCYTERYMRHNNLQKKQTTNLSIKESAEIQGITEDELRIAIDASTLRFTEITSMNTTLVCNPEKLDSGVRYLQTIPKEIYDILEEIFLDGTREERVFIKYGMTPQQGRKLIKKYIKELHSHT